MYELAFSDALRPALVSVLKLPLLRYSVGHEIILLSRRNPLLAASREEFDRLPAEQQRTAIIVAADVCCQGWAEYHRVYNAWQRWRLARKWAQWTAAIAGADFALAIAEWRNYRAAGSDTFSTEEMPNTGAEFRFFGQPELSSLVNFLQITCRLGEADIFDYPLGYARMRHLAWLESEGAVRITNAMEAEIARRKSEYEKAHTEPEFELNPKD